MPTWDGIVRHDQRSKNARKFYERITTESLLKTLLGDRIEDPCECSIPQNTAFVTDDNETYSLLCNCSKDRERCLDKCPHMQDEVLYSLIREKYKKMEALLKNFYVQRNVTFDIPQFNSILEKSSSVHVAYEDKTKNKEKHVLCNKKPNVDVTPIPHVHRLNHIHQIIQNPDPNLTVDEVGQVVHGHLENEACNEIRKSIMENHLLELQEELEAEQSKNENNNMNNKKKKEPNLKKKKKELMNRLDNPEEYVGKSIFSNSESSVNCYLSEHTTVCVDPNGTEGKSNSKENSNDEGSSKTVENTEDISKTNELNVEAEKENDEDNNNDNNNNDVYDDNSLPIITEVKKMDNKLKSPHITIPTSMFPPRSGESSANASDPNYHPLLKPRITSHFMLSSTDNSYNENSGELLFDGIPIHDKNQISLLNFKKESSSENDNVNDNLNDESPMVKPKKKKHKKNKKDKKDKKDKKEKKEKKGNKSNFDSQGQVSFVDVEDTSTSTTKQESSSSSHKKSKSSDLTSSEGDINNVNAKVLKGYWKETIRLINRYNLAIIQEMMKNPCPMCKEVFESGGELRALNKQSNKKHKKLVISNMCTHHNHNHKHKHGNSSVYRDPLISNEEHYSNNENNDNDYNNNATGMYSDIYAGTPMCIEDNENNNITRYNNSMKGDDELNNDNHKQELLEPGVILSSLTCKYNDSCPDCIPMCHILTAMAQENILFDRIEKSNRPNYEETIRWIFELSDHISTNRIIYLDNTQSNTTTKFKISKFRSLSPRANHTRPSYIETNLIQPGMSLMISFSGLVKPYSVDDEYKALKRGEIIIDEEHNKKKNKNNNNNNKEKTVLQNKQDLENMNGFGSDNTNDMEKVEQNSQRLAVDGVTKLLTLDGKPVEYIRTKGKHKKIDVTLKSQFTFEDFKTRYKEASGRKSKLPSICYKLALFSGVILSALKLFAFIISNSMIMMASMIDSCLDILSSLILLITSKIANSKKNDYRLFPVGKKRIQTIGVLIFACIMSAFALQILSQAIIDISSGPGNSEFGVWPIVTMAAAVFTKATLLTITKLSIKKLKKSGDPNDTMEIDGMEACAQDHINDMLSNGFGLIFGIVSKYAWYLDPAASMCLSLFIIYNWGKTAFEQIKSLLGCGASPDFVQLVTYICVNFDSRIVSVSDVVCYHTGTQITVDLLLIFSSSTDIKTYNTVTRELKNYVEGLAEVEKCNIRVTTTDDPYC